MLLDVGGGKFSDLFHIFPQGPCGGEKGVLNYIYIEVYKGLRAGDVVSPRGQKLFLIGEHPILGII